MGLSAASFDRTAAVPKERVASTWNGCSCLLTPLLFEGPTSHTSSTLSSDVPATGVITVGGKIPGSIVIRGYASVAQREAQLIEGQKVKSPNLFRSDVSAWMQHKQKQTMQLLDVA